jgi:hypothetical protein
MLVANRLDSPERDGNIDGRVMDISVEASLESILASATS